MRVTLVRVQDPQTCDCSTSRQRTLLSLSPTTQTRGVAPGDDDQWTCRYCRTSSLLLNHAFAHEGRRRSSRLLDAPDGKAVEASIAG